jgi:hypothetical protein
MRYLTCADLVEQANDYLDGTGSVQAGVDFDAHLRICEGCQDYLDQLRTTVWLLQRTPPEQLSQETCAQILELFGQRRGA